MRQCYGCVFIRTPPPQSSRRLIEKERASCKKQLVQAYYHYLKAIEDARPLPLQTAPILEIIQEEAADYFNSIKNAEEVIKVINNRVQLYLNEK